MPAGLPDKKVKNHIKNLGRTLKKFLPKYTFELKENKDKITKFSVLSLEPLKDLHPVTRNAVREMASCIVYDIFVDGKKLIDYPVPTIEMSLTEASTLYDTVVTAVCKALKVPDIDIFRSKR